METRRRIGTPIIDERGAITNILEVDIRIKSILLITSKAGSIRANHYHKKDSHYVYLLNGSMEYTEKDMSAKNGRKRSFLLHAGDLVLAPPMMAHAMRFLEDTTFLAFTTEQRDQKSYERDTIRLELIKP